MINKILSYISLFLIRLYQIILSPDKGLPRFWLKGKVCRHRPHCSQYALEHIQQFGFFRSFLPIIDRVSNCLPGNGIIYDPVRYNVVFFSSAAIGIPFLEYLHNDDKFHISGIVTQPDQPSGRGLEIKPNVIKAAAARLGIRNISTPQTLKLVSKKYPGEGEQFEKWLHKAKPDFLVVIAYGKIIPPHILDIASIAPINIHGSLLPSYRGASPIQTALLNGDKQTGITIMKMAAGLDEGDIIAQLQIPLSVDTNAQDLINTFGEKGPSFTNETLMKYATGHLIAHPQQHSSATYTKKIEKEDGAIDLHNTPLLEIIRKYNAYYLRPKVYFTHDGKRNIIEHMEVSKTGDKKHFSEPLITKEYVINPLVRKLQIKPEGKKAMSWDERKRGYLKSSQ